MIDLPPPNYQQTIQAIVKCGVERAVVSIQYADYLQADEVTIKDLGLINGEKVKCLKGAVHPSYILTITNPAQQSAFYDLSAKQDRPEAREAAIHWVRSNKPHAVLPHFGDSRDLKAFAESLERACGLKAGSTVEVVGASALTVRRDVIVGSGFGKLGRTMECVMNMFTASDATENGIAFIFIGNEALAEEK